MSEGLDDIRTWPGYIGSFVRADYPGAMKMGTRVRKVNGEPGDATPDGTLGTVLGSVGHPDIAPVILYFVEWDNRPTFAVGLVSMKVEAADATAEA